MVNHPNRRRKPAIVDLTDDGIIKTSGPVDPTNCPFPPLASVVLDPWALDEFADATATGREKLAAWIAKWNSYPPTDNRQQPCVHAEGDFLYFRYAYLSEALIQKNPLFRRPSGDAARWKANDQAQRGARK